MSIREDEVHVWVARPSRVTDVDALTVLEGVLSSEELDRMARFRFSRDQDSFRVSHALLRLALSRYEATEPQQWRLATDEHGRPELDPVHGSRLRFNLSHTSDVVVVAVAIDRSVGVDVESTDRRIDVMGSLEHYLAPLERFELRRLPAREQRPRFFAYWTLKEAYIKARGLGLAIPLDQFAFRIREGEPISVEFASGIDDEPEAWQFFQQWLSDDHSLAVAVPRRGADLEIVVRPASGLGLAIDLGV